MAKPASSVSGGQIAIPSRVSLLFLAGSLFFTPLGGLKLIQYVSWSDILLVFAVFSAVVEAALRGAALEIDPMYILVIFCLVVPLVAAGFRADELHVLAFLVASVSMALIPICIYFIKLESLDEAEFLLLSWTLGGLVGVIYLHLSVHGYVGAIQADPHWKWHGRAKGLTYHPSLAGVCVYLTVPGLLYFAIRSKRIVLKVLIGFLMLATLKALDYTGTRAAFVALLFFFLAFMGLSVLWVREKRERFNLSQGFWLVFWGGMGTVCLFVASSVGIIEPLFGSLWDRFFRSDPAAVGSLRLRSEYNAVAVSGFFESPIWGQGYFWHGFSGAKVAHNAYLQYAQVGGLFGLAALGVYLFRPVWLLCSRVWISPVKSHRRLGTLLLAACASVIVLAFASSSMNDMSIGAAFYLALLLSHSTKLWEV